MATTNCLILISRRDRYLIHSLGDSDTSSIVVASLFPRLVPGDNSWKAWGESLGHGPGTGTSPTMLPTIFPDGNV